MKNFAAYEYIDHKTQSFSVEFDDLEKLKNNFPDYPKFYYREPSYPHVKIVLEELIDSLHRKRIGIIFMGK